MLLDSHIFALEADLQISLLWDILRVKCPLILRLGAALIADSFVRAFSTYTRLRIISMEVLLVSQQ